MDNPFDNFNFDDLFRILIVVVFIGGGIVRTLYNAFFKRARPPGRPAGGEGRPAGGEGRPAGGEGPPPVLQEFLDEFRRQRDKVPEGPKPADEAAAPREAVPKRPRAEPLEQAPARRRVEPWERDLEKARRRREQQPAQAAAPEQRQPEAPDREPAPKAPATRRSLAVELESKRLSKVEDRRIESRVEAQMLRGRVEDRHLETDIGNHLAAKFGPTLRAEPRARTSARLPGMPAGVGLREAMLLKAMLGPPVSQQSDARGPLLPYKR